MTQLPAPDALTMRRRLSVWAWTTAIAVATALVATWASGVLQVKTKVGVIVVENAPDDAELFVDGERIIASWPGGGAPLEVSIPEGKHGVLVKKEGFETFGENVSVQSGGKQSIRVKLMRSTPRVTLTPNPEVVATTSANPSAEIGQVTPTATPPGTPQVVATTPADPSSSRPAVPVAPKVEVVGKLQILTNSIGMKFSKISDGEFKMGSPEEHLFANDNEKPQHPVKIPRPFYLGIHEVTQGQYRQVTGEGSDDPATRDMPVTMVARKHAILFCNLLSELENLEPYYRLGKDGGTGGNGYRLPREAEWEYACRAGTTSQFLHGNNPFGPRDYAWFRDNSGGAIHPVGQLKPNAFVLYDMIGNVSEWCLDKSDVPFEALQATGDIDLALTGTPMIRGGDRMSKPGECRPAWRWYAHGLGGPSVGIRVARDVDANPPTGTGPATPTAAPATTPKADSTKGRKGSTKAGKR